MLALLIAGFGIRNTEGLLAAATGSLIVMLPNAYFCFQAFRYKASEDPVRALGASYRGEAGKLVLVMVFSALSFRFLDIREPLILFLAMAMMLVVQTLAAGRLIARTKVELAANDIDVACKQKLQSNK